LIALQAMTPKAIAENYNTTRKVISEGGLVKQEQQGGELIIHLKLKNEEIGKWLEQFRKIWETRFKQLDIVLSTIKKQKK
jgi:hypothetical protein